MQTQTTDQFLSTWGTMLWQECNRQHPGETAAAGEIAKESSSVGVVLSGARHVYAWWKAKSEGPSSSSSSASRNQQPWRGMDPKEYWKELQYQPTASSMEEEEDATIMDYHQKGGAGGWGATPLLSLQEEEIGHYRNACRAKALELLEQSAGTPFCWGPHGDPMYALHATVVWNSERLVEAGGDGWSSTTLPKKNLGSFSSSRNSSKYANQSILNVRRCSRFKLKAFLDQDALEPTLATNQRCVLACLARTMTLAPLTLLRHLLWEEDIVEEWDHEAGSRAALDVAQDARVGDATKTLIDVMDWKTCAEEMISSDEAHAIVQEVLEGSASFFGFPSPPEGMFTTDKTCHSSTSPPLLAPLFKSAPIGRLLSDLCVRMAHLRTPCSMSMVWTAFCAELRHRWDMREPLPQMNFIPGLDPSPAALAEQHKVSTIGVKADLAAFLNSTEPDPDAQHCLIGQKLQVCRWVYFGVVATRNRGDC